MQWEGCVYRKGRKWWLKFKRLGSEEWCAAPSCFYLDDPQGEEKARAMLQEVRDLWSAHQRAAGGEGLLTVQKWGEKWIAKRVASGKTSAPLEEQRLRDYVYPTIGSMPLTEISRSHARAVMEAVQTRPSCPERLGRPADHLAPRTVLQIYRTVRRLFRAAIHADLIGSNPFDLDRSELPKWEDKDPLWRADARLTTDEVEKLISDARIPEERRVLYAIEFLTGTRAGEAAALRWCRWERNLKPLGRLTIAVSWNSSRHVEKATKTGRVRQVPVHPVLAKVLAAWKLGGFQRYTGHAPTDDDLIVPSATGKHRKASYSWQMFHRDLAVLGLRLRRHHDSRRTFRSMAGDGGAARDRVRWLTHAPVDVLDSYDSPSWESLCEAVLCIRIRSKRGNNAVTALPSKN
jgi:integrase